MRRFRRWLALPLLAAIGGSGACATDPAAADADLASQLEHDTGTRWNVYVDPRSQEVRFLAPEAPVAIGSGSAEEKARAFFARYASALHATGKPDELTIVSSLTDPRGGEHLRFQHTLPGTGLPVFHAGTTAHFTADGSLSWMQTDFRADLAGLDPTPAITSEAATAIASAHVEAACGTGQSKPTADRTDLGVLADPESPAALVYRVLLSARTAKCTAPAVFVDARSGLVRSVEERSHGAASKKVEGSRFYRAKDANDKKSIDITFTGTSTAPTYAMITEAAPNERVFTHAFGSKSALETNDPGVWDATSPVRGAAVDAHFFTRQALPFLRAFHGNAVSRGRLSSPPLGSDVHVFVHDNTTDNGANAHAHYDVVTGWDTVELGDGNPAVANELPYSAAYDVVAHELGHLVIEHTSGLVNAIDPGALNESFADVMGAAAEHALAPDDAKNFTIGEDLYFAGPPGPKALRSMTAPQSLGSPDHVDGKVPCPPGGLKLGQDDNCGVHTNSGIPNRAFSLIVAGGSLYKLAPGRAPELRPIGVPSGLGWTQATELTYWATTGLGPTASFEVAALAQIAEALVVGGVPAATTVSCAWYAVGVFTPRTPIERSALDLYCKPPPSPAPAPPPKPSGVTGANPCAGHGDAIVCDPAVSFQAVACKNGAMTVPPRTLFCADLARTCKPANAGDPTAVTEDGALVCE